MEATEVAADDEEDAERSLGVFDDGKNLGLQAEADGDLGRLIKVGLEDRLVEDEEGLEDGNFVAVVHGLADLRQKLVARENLVGLQALVRKGGAEARVGIRLSQS